MDYEYFKQFILKLTTIDLNQYKERQMKRRIESLMARHGYQDFEPYSKALKDDKDLLNEFINFITINVSEFYRNPSLWDTLDKKIIPELIDRFGKNLKIWSAACSTGDEPYTLAMVMMNHVPDANIKIIATDIDNTVLSKAKAGLYMENSLKGLPKEYKDKYFEKIDDRTYAISDKVKKCVEFKQADLLKDRYPDSCDLIVCRNVMIYFTEEAKAVIYKKFNDSLKKDAFLFVGNTEQIMNYKEMGYTFDDLFFYKKV